MMGLPSTYGRVDANMPMPVGGGATSSQPVGAILQRLMAMYGGQGGAPSRQAYNLWQGQDRGGPQAPPGFDRAMAELLGLVKRPQQAAQGRPMENWIGAR